MKYQHFFDVGHWARVIFHACILRCKSRITNRNSCLPKLAATSCALALKRLKPGVGKSTCSHPEIPAPVHSGAAACRSREAAAHSRNI